MSPQTQTSELMTNSGANFEAPLGGVSRGKLVVISGISRLSLRGDAAMSQLMRANFERPLPNIKVRDGAVRVHYSNYSLLNWLIYWRQPLAELRINSSIPWNIEVRGGVSNFDADLSQVQLTDLFLQGGVSHSWTILSSPSGTVPIRVIGGVSDMTILRPASVPVRIQVQDGVSSLTFDDQHFGPLQNLPRLESPGYTEAANRYDIQISGGVSNLVVQK
jgi:hypothetical protein